MIQMWILIKFPESYPDFHKYILYILHTKDDSIEDNEEITRKVCCGVIECKPIKGRKMRRQDDSHCESLSILTLKQSL